MKKHNIISLIIVILLIFVLVSPNFSNAGTDCVEPYDGQVFTESAILCPGDYYIPHGVKIGANGVALNCNGARLNGNPDAAGIYVNNRSDIAVENCFLFGYSHGISTTFFWGGLPLSNSKISNNYIQADTYGLYIKDTTGSKKSKNNIIQGNFISVEHLNAILLSFSDSNIITNNTIDNGRDGLAGINFQSSNKNVVSKNTIIGTGNGIVIKGQKNKILSNLIIDPLGFFESTAIAIMPGSNNSEISGNSVILHRYGIRLRDTSNIQISSNSFLDNIYGIAIDGHLENVNVNLNNIVQEAGDIAFQKHIANGAPETLNAELNYYGTTDQIIIFNKISGKVDFCPYLDSPYPDGNPLECNQCKGGICPKA